MPDNQSQEKVDILRTLGAEVRVVKTVPYKDPMNYQKQAGRFAAELPGAVWANQFDNVANRQAHYESTGAGDLGRNERSRRRVHVCRRHRRYAWPASAVS